MFKLESVVELEKNLTSSRFIVAEKAVFGT
jgi:hypothetical protein